MSRPIAVTAVLLLAIATIAGPVSAGPLRVLDLDGRPVDPLGPNPGVKATVFVFIATDCPIANRYAPDIQQLSLPRSTCASGSCMPTPTNRRRPSAIT
jgi:hypothetical protein